MMEYLSWGIAGAALLGTWFNIRQDRRCFAIWCCTNGFWTLYDTWHDLYAQALLFALYFCMAVIGFVRWKDN